MEEFKFPRQVKFLGLFFSIFILSVIALLGFSGFFDNSYRNGVLENEYRGRVVRLINDRQNHNALTAELSNQRRISVYFPLEKDNPTLKLNDSIVKQKNSVYILVFRNGKFYRTLNTLYIDD